ncbi:CrcB family protein, partial [Alicyclobacillaceae bacterium I2511]
MDQGRTQQVCKIPRFPVKSVNIGGLGSTPVVYAFWAEFLSKAVFCMFATCVHIIQRVDNVNRNKHFLSSNWLPTLSVGIGGFVGAILRYQLTRLMTPNSPAPLATWVINVSGSFILSWLYTVTIEKYPIHP